MTARRLAATGDAPAPPPPAPQEGAAGALAAPARPRVLIVEDDYFVGLASEAALLDAGLEVLAVAASGEEALALAAAAVPTLAVMDIRLAGALDGIATALALRARGIPSVFASAQTDAATRARAEGAAPLGWVGKPYSDGDLVAAVRRALAALGEPPQQ